MTTSTAGPTPNGIARAPRRERHELTGPSVWLDPLNHAVRRDLADIRLADRVFAPHYAAPLPRVVRRATPLLATPEAVEPLVRLTAGEPFEVLELAGGRAWGFAPGPGLAGYIDAGALKRDAA